MTSAIDQFSRVGEMGASAASVLQRLSAARVAGDTDMNSQEMLAVLDLLFAQAGIGHEASAEEVTAKLGEEGVRLIVRFYNSVAEKENRDTLSVDTFNVSDMSDEDDASSTQSDKPRGKYNKETEISINRIFSLGKVTPPVHAHISPYDPYEGAPAVTMTGFGELGRFGNQILQYVFLQCYADRVGAEVQLPYWVGKELFGLDNRPVQRAFPAVIETKQTKANSTFTDEFLNYITRSNDGNEVAELFPADLANTETAKLPVNVDVWGWFQWHTRAYAPFRERIQQTFTPVPALTEHFDDIIETKLRMGGKRTLVGCHLRLGDYKNIAASSFGYVAPTQWYLDWLEKIWPTLENPVLFVASDEVDTVLRDFSKFNPVTADSLGAEMPDEFADLGAGMFPDWYILSRCDVAAISNSTFSFSACMMNPRPNARFFRAHYAKQIVEINPWDDEVIVHRDMDKTVLGNGVQTLRLLYNTQGTRGVLQNLFFELPYYALRSVIMKAVLKKQQLSPERQPQQVLQPVAVAV